MGQAQTQLKQNQDYRLIEELAVGNIVKHNKTQSLHFLKQYSFTAQEAYQNALNMHSLKLANKNQHVLNFLHFTTKSENSFCSSFHKIILIFEYSDYSLEKELACRIRDRNPFNEKEIWSILCSCIIACVHLVHCQGRMHCGLTPKDIRQSSNGCIKLLSHEMIGIDPSHTQAEGVPKMLAMTIIQCITMESVNNQDTNYLDKKIQSLDCSRQMKEMLSMMVNGYSTFLQLEEHLFKLVQDDQSLASHSNTPILKSHSPLSSSGYKCPRIPQQDISKMKTPLSGSVASNSHSHVHSQQLEPSYPDSEDIRSYLFQIDQNNVEIQNPDENDQEEQNYQNQDDDSSPHQINSFYLKERKNSGKNQEQQKCSDQVLKNIEKMFIKKQYQINPVQSSRRKQIQINAEQYKPKILKEAIELPQSLTYQNNLFTDPKLFSIIKSDLEEIKMRRSIGELGKYTISKQLDRPALQQFIPEVPSQRVAQNYTLIQQKTLHTQKVNQSIRIEEVSQVSGWFKETSIQNASENHKTDTNLELQNLNAPLKQIQIIREVSQEYREDQEDKKSKRSVREQSKHTKNDSDRVSEKAKTELGKLEQQKIDNIMNDTCIGFKKKKQSTGKFEVPKQPQSQVSQPSTQLTTLKNKQNIQHFRVQQKVEQKSKTVGMKPIQQKSNRMLKQQQFFDQYAPSQTSQPQSSHPSSRSAQSQSVDKESQNMKLVQVSQKYTRGHYQGTKLNGKRHGYGTFHYSEGGKYVGNWRENKMHGKGVLYYPNQKVAYDGEWQNDQLNGYGVLYNQEVTPLRTPFDYRDWADAQQYWVKYQGHFYQDNKEGQGKIYLVNGERLEAEFHDDKVDGQGTLYRGDGTSVRGKWRQNKLIRMF